MGEKRRETWPDKETCVSGGFKGRRKISKSIDAWRVKRVGAARRRTRSQALMADSKPPPIGGKSAEMGVVVLLATV